MQIFKLDIHNHTSDFSHFLFTHPNRKKYVKELLSKLFKKHGNIVLGISDYNSDNRYALFLKVLKHLKEYKVDWKNKDYFVVISEKKTKEKIYLIHTNELGTNKGHILVVGFKGKIKTKNLKEILKEAHRQKAIIIANHSLHEFSIPYFLVSKILKCGKLSLSKKDLIKNEKNFDAVELNSYFPEDWKRIRSFAKKENLPVIADSDAHFLNELFTSDFELKNLNFSNPKKFKKSFRKSLKKVLKVHAKSHGFEAKYKHELQVLFENFLMKIGLISFK